MRTLLSIFIFAVLMPAQQKPQPWTVEGDVTSDRGPIQGAAIRCDGPQWVDTTSDANGHYTLKGSRPGTYSITAEKDGFGDAKPTSVSVLPALQVDHVDFQLTKGAVIAGHVLDAEKNPIPGVMVYALVNKFQDGKRSFLGHGNAKTDDQGEYRILDLPEGQYFVSVIPELLHPHKRPPMVAGEKPKPTQRQGLVRSLFYPNLPTPAGASPIFLHWGEQREAVDLLLNRVGTFCITATVLPAANDGSLPNVSLKEASPEWGAVLARDKVKPGEEFEICGVPPGSYRIGSDAWTQVNSATFKLTGWVEMNFAVSKADVELGSLYIAPPLTLQGKVTIDGARAEDPVPEGLVISLDRNQRPNFYGENLKQPVHPSGEFALENLLVHDYILHLTGLPNGFYIKEASQQGHDALHDLVWPGRGDVRIVLGADGVTITGNTVDKDNQPVPDAIVILASKDGPPVLISQQSDQDGRFQFISGLPPGDYKLAALTGLVEGEAQDPEFAQANLSGATDVTFASKGSQSVTLTVRKVR
jgi:protocatechuate 3,4-dioxygenase beta subunit